MAGLEHDRLSLDGSFSVVLASMFDDSRIHYTLDDSEPTVGISPLLGIDRRSKQMRPEPSSCR